MLIFSDPCMAFKDLAKLSRLFKDAIAYPLLQKAKLGMYSNFFHKFLPRHC